jgi:amino acid transporter
MRLIVLHQGWEPHDHPHMPGSGVAHGIDQMNAVLHHSLAWTHLVVIGASSGAASGISCSAGLPSFEKGAATEDRPYSPSLFEPSRGIESGSSDQGAAGMQSSRMMQPNLRKIGLLPLIGVIFFTVSGGAYGIEPLVGQLNAGWAVVLIVVTPILWGLPISMMAAELSSAMPEEGGYYFWVRAAMGNFWGVQEGWWTICYTAVDMAIYPVLFVNYLAYFLPSLALDEKGSSSWHVFFIRWLLAILLIGIALAVNWKGARAVGGNAVVSGVLVLLPFVILAIAGLAKSGAPRGAWSAVTTGLAGGPDAGLLALGLSVVLWNYSGWDNVSTFAGEVTEPQRNYPRAFLVALPLIVLCYLLPLFAGIAVTTDASVWSESAGWPVIANLIGGSRLGAMIAIAALVSSWALFNSQLLYVSRLPYAMARDGWLPSALAKVSSRNGVPIAALVASCAVTACFVAFSFGKLVVIDILLYAAGLALELVALIVLRLKNPGMGRPFRVPGGRVGLALVAICPMLVICVVFWASVKDAAAKGQLLIVIFLIVSGPLVYLLRRRFARA